MLPDLAGKLHKYNFLISFIYYCSIAYTCIKYTISLYYVKMHITRNKVHFQLLYPLKKSYGNIIEAGKNNGSLYEMGVFQFD